MARTVDRIAADVERGRLQPAGWGAPDSPTGRTIRVLLSQSTRAGLLDPVDEATSALTLTGQFWSLQIGTRLARLVQTT